MHLKRARPGHGDKLPALEADQRLTGFGLRQVGDNWPSWGGTSRIVLNAATTGDATCREYEAQRQASGKHGGKAAEQAQGEQSSERGGVHHSIMAVGGEWNGVSFHHSRSLS